MQQDYILLGCTFVPLQSSRPKKSCCTAGACCDLRDCYQGIKSSSMNFTVYSGWDWSYRTLDRAFALHDLGSIPPSLSESRASYWVYPAHTAEPGKLQCTLHNNCSCAVKFLRRRWVGEEPGAVNLMDWQRRRMTTKPWKRITGSFCDE